MSSRLGIGGARFHVGSSEGEAETVYLGVFRRATLERLGGFDEHFPPGAGLGAEPPDPGRRRPDLVLPDLWVTLPPAVQLEGARSAVLPHRAVAPAGDRQYPETASPRYLAPPVAVVAIVAGTAAGLVGLVGGPKELRLGWLVPGAYVVAVGVGSQLIAPGADRRERAWLPLVVGDHAHDLGRGLPRPAAPARPALDGGAQVQGEGAGVTPAPAGTGRRVLMLVQSPVAGELPRAARGRGARRGGPCGARRRSGGARGVRRTGRRRRPSVGRGTGLRPAGAAARPALDAALRPVFDAARWLLLPEHRAGVERAWRDGAGELVRAHVREHGVPDVVHAHDFNTLELAAQVATEPVPRSSTTPTSTGAAGPGTAAPSRCAAAARRPAKTPCCRASTSC